MNDKSKMTCVGCGRPGVTICAGCSKKPYRSKLAAREDPLEKRDPQLYKRLDELSRSSLGGHKRLWDEFCTEIRADRLYEHLPILVEIVREGKWRTDALKPKVWLRQQFANRVGKTGNDDDYGQTGKRRARGPKFDKRNGALISYETRPYTEFEIHGVDGETLTGDEVIDGRLARARLQRRDGDCQLLADRESLRSLRGHTYAESIERDRCKWLFDKLEHDKPAFDKVLAGAIQEQGPLTTNLGLDPDEAEVLALTSLLWSVGSRVYLNFVDQSDKKRLRNAWDRVDRKWKKPAFRQTLRKFAQNTRREWESLDLPDRSERYYQEDRPVSPKRDPGGCDRCGALDRRWCTCGVGGRKRKPKPEVQLQLRGALERQMGTLLPPSPSDTPKFVDESAVVLSSSAKKSKRGYVSKLYSE